ncbi:MAG: crosslink repair DNA glycosylase YcaQ family protein [Actinomycetota bacterium]
MARRLTLDRARRMALGAQGFADRRPTGRVDARHFDRVLDRMAILQLDSVNVICRSHFLPVLARLGPYDPDALDRHLWRSGRAFEYLAHEASISPMQRHPLLRFRMAAGRWKAGRALEEERPDYLRSIVEQVETEGPLAVGDLHDPGGRGGSWWGWSPGKVALEWLYVTGRLSIAFRTKAFVTHYELPERVIPADVLAAPTPTLDESLRELVLVGARSAGVGTAADLADWFRLPIRPVRKLVPELVATGELEEVEVEGWDEPAFVHPEASIPRRIEGTRLLSPFDPVVWFRPRAERLFGFRYRIEIYVPEQDRVHGYYVLPVLSGSELVGRLDLKADRRAGTLLVRGSFAEDHADPDIVADDLVEPLHELAGFLGLADVVVHDRGDLAPSLGRAVTSA